MRLLLAVKSCQRDQQSFCHQAIRDTWGKNLPDGVDLRFFMGGTSMPLMEADEVYFPVDDGYWELTPKTKGICKYTVDCHYDYVYLCDTDTYLVVPHLLESAFQKYDFSGGHLCYGEHGAELGKAYPRWVSPRGGVADPFYAYMSGGVGFFLSKKAAEAVATTSYYHHSEDVWVGQVLGPMIASGEIKAGVLKDFEGYAAWHLNCGYYGGGHTNRLSAAEAIKKHHDIR
jgi:Galactosyltransferase